MATWTKTNNVITLTQDTTMSELVNDSDIPLADADIIQLKGHNLIVDIITCGSADPDYNDEVNMGVTLKNDGGGECNLEFKDLSGIRLNATLPGTIHPWVDPDNPLPVITKDPRKVIHGDPYCTKLTANARAEIQLAGNFGLGGGEANLPTETRDGNFWALQDSSSGTTITFNRDFPLHKNDIVFQMMVWGTPSAIVKSYNSTTKIADFSTSISNIKDTLYGLLAGGFLVSRFNNSTATVFTSDIKAGTLNYYSTKTTSNRIICFYNLKINANRMAIFISSDSGFASTFSKIFCNIKQLATPHLTFRWNSASNSECDYCFLRINEIACWSLSYHNTSNGGTTGKIYISNGYITKTNQSFWPFPIKLIFENTTNGIGYALGNNPFFYCHTINCNINNTLISNTIFESTGKIEKSSTFWHHKPNSSLDTTWKYYDHLISPKSILRLKLRRMVESASSASEARVAITDTANWYPQTKYGALSELVMNNLETDKWYTFNLQYRNPTDEPLQVRVWECVSGSTDGGYLRVEEATGGPM